MQLYPLPSLLVPEIATIIKYANDIKPYIDSIKSLLTGGLLTQPYPLFAILFGVSGHFKTHLCIGGYAADLSITTNDVILWLFHQYDDYIVYKYYLSQDDLLVPESYSLDIKLMNNSKNIVISNIDEYNLTFWHFREAFQLRHYDLCYIYDQLVRPINQMLKNE
jgi:hypothetical protein